MKRCGAALLACCVLLGAAPAPDVNPGAQILRDFDKHVSDYIKLRKTAKVQDSKSTPSAAELQRRERQWAQQIRELRPSAAQGEIFTPEVAAEFRRLIGITMQGPETEKIRASLRRAEPVRLKALRVNQTYPHHVPLQSTPPSLLLNLPQLPPELDYRVVGDALVLHDTGANIIVDFISHAIP